MPMLQILRGIVADPNLALFVFGDQSLQWQIDSQRWRSHHQRRSSLRTAEDQDFGWAHLQANLLSLAAVVNQSKYLKPALLEHSFKTRHGIIHRIPASSSHQTVVLHGRIPFTHVFPTRSQILSS